MLCWAVKASADGVPPYCRGTVTDYTLVFVSPTASEGRVVKPFSLLFNGPTGLFETFWRSYDGCCRNSLLRAEAEFLLPASVQLQIQPHRGYLLNGQPVLIDRLHLQLDKPQVPVKAQLLTTRPYAPVSSAPTHDRIYHPETPDQGAQGVQYYDWVMHGTGEVITKEQYDGSKFRSPVFPEFFPPVPCKELLGQQLYKQIIDYKSGSTYRRETYTITCEVVSWGA